MKFFALGLTALLLSAAGCAQNRYQDPDIAPSQLASRNMNASGWSVPPGRHSVTDPAPAARMPSGRKEGETAGKAPRPSTQPVPPANSGWSSDIAEANRPANTAPVPGWRRANPNREPRRQTADRGMTERPRTQWRTAGTPGIQGNNQTTRVKPLVPAFPLRSRRTPVDNMATVNFAFDRFDLNPEAKATLEANARWLIANPHMIVRIGGHADERGTGEYNLALGERRALKVHDFLVDKGVPPENLVTVSFGEEMPLVTGADPQSWAKNRRAEFGLVTPSRFSAMASRSPGR